MAVFLILLCPALTLGSIDVHLGGVAGSDPSKLKLSFAGQQANVISDQERNSFKVGDKNLKEGAKVSFGKSPTDSYLHSPTPHGDLYKTYGWDPVVRTLVPKSGRILSVSDKLVIVKEQIFENNSTVPGTYNVAISQQLTNTFSSSWTKEQQLTIGQEISYGFDFIVHAGGSTSFSYTSTWGETTEKSTETTVGSSTGVEIELAPGQAVVASLQASQGSVTVQMEYEASLSGFNAVNYKKPYLGHHFWALNIGEVMAGARLSNKLRSTQIVNIGFYTNSYITVSDLRTKVSYIKQRVLNIKAT